MFGIYNKLLEFDLLKDETGEPLVSEFFDGAEEVAYITVRCYFNKDVSINVYLDCLYHLDKIPYEVINTFYKDKYDAAYLDINCVINNEHKVFCKLNFLHTDKEINTIFFNEKLYIPYSCELKIKRREADAALLRLNAIINSVYGMSLYEKCRDIKTRRKIFVYYFDEAKVKDLDDDLYVKVKLDRPIEKKEDER